MMADPEKKIGGVISEKARMEGMEEQKERMMGDGNGDRMGHMEMKEEEEEPKPLHKAIRKPAFRALLGYITTFVGVFNG